MKVTLGVQAWEQTPELSLEELMGRLARSFPSAVIDQERGDARVQEKLDQLEDDLVPPAAPKAEKK